jgi:brefeldin A-inhibited guanine nucleotide-exchange protein
VVDVIEGYTSFQQEEFEKHIETFYPLVVDLLGRDLRHEERVALQILLRRIGEAKLGIAPSLNSPLVTSRRSSVSTMASRKLSRGR